MGRLRGICQACSELAYNYGAGRRIVSLLEEIDKAKERKVAEKMKQRYFSYDFNINLFNF